MVRSLTMVPTGNKAKRLSSVNHITKTIHHHHHHYQEWVNMQNCVQRIAFRVVFE